MAPIDRDASTTIEDPDFGAVLVPRQRGAELSDIILPSAWWPTDRIGTISAVRIEKRHSRGGTGVVYRAVELSTGRRLAVKVPRVDRSTAAESISSEIEVLRRLSSPFVVRFEGSGIAPDGRPWLAMELLEGQSLQQRLAKRDVMGLAGVICCLRQACLGLGDIHDAGWVHHDIKPSNLILGTERQHLKLIDFGIARRIGERTRMLCGTPDYIAPEQVRGVPADPRSDIYALGCTAYELVTGRRLVSELEPMAKVRAHVKGVRPRWCEISNLPQRLQTIIEACLSYAPEDRPASAYDVEDALCRVAMTLADGSDPDGSSSRPFGSPDDSTIHDLPLSMLLQRNGPRSTGR